MGSVSGLTVRRARIAPLLEVISIFAAIRQFRRKSVSLHVLQNHAERMNSKIYTILFNSSRERKSAVKKGTKREKLRNRFT